MNRQLIQWFKDNFYPIDQVAPNPVNTGDSAKDSFNRMRNRWNLIYAGPIVRNWALLTLLLFIITDLLSAAIEFGGVVVVALWICVLFGAFVSAIFTTLWFFLWWKNGFNKK